MAMTSLDERLLVEAHNGGDADAFASIVTEYSSSLYAHAMMRLGESRAAEDAVQETFLRAYRAMPRFEGEFHLRAWLHRILTNVCFDEGDRRRRETRTFDRLASLADPAMPAADEMLDFDRAFAEREVATALAALPDAYREALELRYVEQLSFRQVADATGVTEENARARVHRGRAALRRLISGPYAFVAMFIPALRKGERAAHAALGGGDGASSAASAATVSQVSTSLAQSAPTFTRLAVELSGPMSTKAGIVAGVVAAATTVAVPVASTVADHSTTPAPTPIVAAPATDAITAPLAAPQDTTVVVDPASPTANGSATAVGGTATPTGASLDAANPPAQETFSAPPSAASTDGGAAQASAASSGPAAATGDAATTASLSSPRTLAGVNLIGTGSAEQVSLTGAATLGGGTALSGSITGTLTVTPGAASDDPVRLDGTLTFAGVDGTSQSIRVAIRANATTDANGVTTYAATAGRYELTDAAGASTSGSLTGSIVVGLGSGSSLTLSFS